MSVKSESIAKIKRIIKTLKTQNDFVKQKTVTATFKGEKVNYVLIYTKNRHAVNQFALEAFSDSDGHGFLFPLPVTQSSIKKSIKMATKKPTAKQLAARKKFAAMAKSGELAKKRAAASKKTTASKRKTGLTGKAAPGITKFAAKNVHVEGVKRDGTLKKGYKYVAGGKIVKVKKTTTKK